MKDRFSSVAQGYAQYRPSYPPELINWINSQCPGHDFAVEAGTGSGQLTALLAPHFRRYLATDISQQQMAKAPQLPHVVYQMAQAHELPAEDASANLLVAAQAAHWFDLPAFYIEADRVLQPGGFLILLGYGLITVNPQVDAVVHDLYYNRLNGHWDAERKMVDDHYAHIPFPWPEVQQPAMDIVVHWDAKHLLGYLATWSGVANQAKANGGHSVLDDMAPDIEAAFGPSPLPCRFPIFSRAGHKPR